MDKELEKQLAIKDWLELLKEDKNLNGAYVSLSQYIYIIDKKNTNLKQALNEIREKLKKHKNDLDYEPWSVYKIDGEILLNILLIIDKVLE